MQEFQVEAQGAGGQGQLEVKVTGPSRCPVPCTVGPAPPGGPHPVTFTPSEEGPHRVEVTYDGHPVPGSPFPVEALLPPDPSKVSMAHVCATGMCVPTPVCPSALLTPTHAPITPACPPDPNVFLCEQVVASGLGMQGSHMGVL